MADWRFGRIRGPGSLDVLRYVKSLASVRLRWGITIYTCYVAFAGISQQT